MDKEKLLETTFCKQFFFVKTTFLCSSQTLTLKKPCQKKHNDNHSSIDQGFPALTSLTEGIIRKELLVVQQCYNQYLRQVIEASCYKKKKYIIGQLST